MVGPQPERPWGSVLSPSFLMHPPPRASLLSPVERDATTQPRGAASLCCTPSAPVRVPDGLRGRVSRLVRGQRSC